MRIRPDDVSVDAVEAESALQRERREDVVTSGGDDYDPQPPLVRHDVCEAYCVVEGGTVASDRDRELCARLMGQQGGTQAMRAMRCPGALRWMRALRWSRAMRAITGTHGDRGNVGRPKYPRQVAELETASYQIRNNVSIQTLSGHITRRSERSANHASLSSCSRRRPSHRNVDSRLARQGDEGHAHLRGKSQPMLLSRAGHD